jgi:hypothetical protein
MNFDKLRRKHSPEELEAAYRAGYLKLKVVNAKNPTDAPREFPNDLREHYSLNVAQGSVITTGNPPGGPSIGAVALLIRDAEWTDHLAVTAATNWFVGIVKGNADSKPRTRDEFAEDARRRFSISERQFREFVWNNHAPVAWKKPGAPNR